METKSRRDKRIQNPASSIQHPACKREEPGRQTKKRVCECCQWPAVTHCALSTALTLPVSISRCLSFALALALSRSLSLFRFFLFSFPSSALFPVIVILFWGLILSGSQSLLSLSSLSFASFSLFLSPSLSPSPIFSFRPLRPLSRTVSCLPINPSVSCCFCPERLSVFVLRP